MILFVEPDAEPSRVTIGSATFLFTVACADEVFNLERKHARDDGSLDVAAYLSDLLTAHVVGWEGLVDAAGNAVDYSDARRDALVPKLTLPPKLRLRELIEARRVAAVAVGKA